MSALARVLSRSGAHSTIIHPSTSMAKKGTKASRKFAASGQLTKKIQARRKHQQIQKKVHKNKSARNKNGRERAHVDGNDREDEEVCVKEKKSSKKRCVFFLSLSVDGSFYAYTGDTVSKACR